MVEANTIWKIISQNLLNYDEYIIKNNTKEWSITVNIAHIV